MKGPRFAGRLTVVAVALVAAAALPEASLAQSQEFGSSLSEAPNANFGCETRPTFTEQSSNGDYFPRPSNTADCTWWQAGVFGAQNAQPTGAVPGDGRITNVAVRSGPTPAAIRFVIMRLFADAASGNRQCCFFVTETGVAQPAPNAITNFTVNLPVERNTNPQNNLVTQDYIGVSAVTGTGTLPLFTNGQNNTLTGYFAGNPVAAFYYPRLGALPSDSPNGPGRREEGIPGFVVTMRSTWAPQGAAPPAPPPGATPVGVGARLLGPSGLVARDGVVPLTVRCLLNGGCRGVAQLRTHAGGARASGRGGRIVGSRRIRIRGGRRARVGVRLNRAGRRLVRRQRRVRLVAVVRLGGAGTVRRNVTVRRGR